jgi:hypothetical protein
MDSLSKLSEVVGSEEIVTLVRTKKEDKAGSRTLTEKIQILENYGTLHTMTEYVQYTLLMENQLRFNFLVIF